MTTQYTVWLEIEEIDESRNHYEIIDTPGSNIATFGNYDEARVFVEHANILLNSRSQFTFGRQHETETATSAAGPYPFKLLMLHGRNDPDKDMKEWGFSSKPIRGVKWMHFTYFSTITIGFESEEATEAARKLTGWNQWDACVLEVAKYGDMIRAADCYYGDFEFVVDTA